MKKIKQSLISIIALIIFSSCTNTSNKEEFFINGAIKGIPEGAKIYLVNESNGITKDSTITIKGIFTFKGSIKYPQKITLKYVFNEEKKEYILWIENSNIEISGEWSKMESIKIVGANKHNAYQLLDKQFDEQTSFLSPEMARLTKENKSDSIPLLIERYYNVSIQFAKENANNFWGIEMMYRLRDRLNKDSIEHVLVGLGSNIKTSDYYKSLILHCKSSTLSVGDRYKNFSAKKISNETVELSNLLKKGKPILLIFGGLACMGENGKVTLKQFYDLHKNDIEVLAFVFTESYNAWENEVLDYPLGIPILSDLKGDHSQIKIEYAVQATPTVYLIDKHGKIVLISIGYGESINDEAKKLF